MARGHGDAPLSGAVLVLWRRALDRTPTLLNAFPGCEDSLRGIHVFVVLFLNRTGGADKPGPTPLLVFPGLGNRAGGGGGGGPGGGGGLGIWCGMDLDLGRGRGGGGGGGGGRRRVGKGGEKESCTF